MTYLLPAKMPEELAVGAKIYKRVGGKDAVKREVASSYESFWHYYFNKQVVGSSVTAIGNRRHFTICTANGRRSVHISLKPQDAIGKRDIIYIWYRYEDQWAGRDFEKAGWGTTNLPGKNAARVKKAVDLLTLFLEAMTKAAAGPTTALPKTLAPVYSAIPVYDAEAAERAFEEQQAAERKVTAPTSDSAAVDDWEDLVD
jgi:hypothetical protein